MEIRRLMTGCYTVKVIYKTNCNQFCTKAVEPKTKLSNNDQRIEHKVLYLFPAQNRFNQAGMNALIPA